MRTIKFRAWDVVEKRMRRVAKLDFPEWIVCVCDDKLNYQCERNSFRNQESDRFILMQYTGLKDKNGIGIWEGDIVRKGPDLTKYGLKNEYQEVIFDKGSFIGKEQGSVGCLQFVLSAYLPELEVVGNVFENPELLESK